MKPSFLVPSGILINLQKWYQNHRSDPLLDHNSITVLVQCRVKCFGCCLFVCCVNLEHLNTKKDGKYYMRKFLMSRGNPGPYVDESTALFTNEAMGERWRVWAPLNVRKWIKNNHMIQDTIVNRILRIQKKNSTLTLRWIGFIKIP